MGPGGRFFQPLTARAESRVEASDWSRANVPRGSTFIVLRHPFLATDRPRGDYRIAVVKWDRRRRARPVFDPDAGQYAFTPTIAGGRRGGSWPPSSPSSTRAGAGSCSGSARTRSS